MLARVDRAMRIDGRRSGELAELTALRCDTHLRTMLATLREACDWSLEQIFHEYNNVTEPDAA